MLICLLPGEITEILNSRCVPAEVLLSSLSMTRMRHFAKCRKKRTDEQAPPQHGACRKRWFRLHDLLLFASLPVELPES